MLNIKLGSLCVLDPLIKIFNTLIFEVKSKIRQQKKILKFNYFMQKLNLNLPPFSFCSGYTQVLSPPHTLCQSIRICPRCLALGTLHIGKKLTLCQETLGFYCGILEFCIYLIETFLFNLVNSWLPRPLIKGKWMVERGCSKGDHKQDTLYFSSAPILSPTLYIGVLHEIS